jgi:hypothetical protein
LRRLAYDAWLLIGTDPLASVPLAIFALKTTEVGNIG